MRIYGRVIVVACVLVCHGRASADDGYVATLADWARGRAVIAERFLLAAQVKQTAIDNRLPYPAHLNIQSLHPGQVGIWGSEFAVLQTIVAQVIGDSEMHVVNSYYGDPIRICVNGLSTVGLNEGQRMKADSHLFKVEKPLRYATASGAVKTIPVIRLLTADELAMYEAPPKPDQSKVPVRRSPRRSSR
jgi:hypothetical protein